MTKFKASSGGSGVATLEGAEAAASGGSASMIKPIDMFAVKTSMESNASDDASKSNALDDVASKSQESE